MPETTVQSRIELLQKFLFFFFFLRQSLRLASELTEFCLPLPGLEACTTEP